MGEEVREGGNEGGLGIWWEVEGKESGWGRGGGEGRRMVEGGSGKEGCWRVGGTWEIEIEIRREGV